MGLVVALPLSELLVVAVRVGNTVCVPVALGVAVGVTVIAGRTSKEKSQNGTPG